MLLARLLTALGGRPTRGGPLAPKSTHKPSPKIDHSGRPKIIFDGAYQAILEKLEGDALAEAFELLNPTDQLKLIEAELAKLPADALMRVQKLLAAHLDKPWLPLPGPQTRALQSEADVLFYGGGAGSGKSSLLCGVSVTEHHRIKLFRRESVQVRGLVDEVQKILKTRNGFNGSSNVWHVPGGERVIEFAHCHLESDKEKHQGRPADLYGFDEITHFLEHVFRYLIGWNRSDRPGQRCRVICTGNPPESAEGRWVLSYWGAWLDPAHPNPAKDGELRWYTTIAGEDREVDGPGPHGTDDLGQPIMARSRTFIKGLLKDNPYLLETGYAATLQANPEPLRSMLLEGRFDIAVSDDPWQVIPSEWIELAQRRWTDNAPGPMQCLGVDVAQGGADETVLAPRHGNWFALPVAIKGANTKDGTAVAALVFATMRNSCSVAIDVGGGWGADAHGHLKAQKIDSHAVNWVEESHGVTRHGDLRFRNKRAEYWWRLREALDPTGGDKIALPPDKTLAADLATPRWKRTPSGLIQVEDKGEIRKRLGRSPDRGDALVMAHAHGLVANQATQSAPPATANLGYASAKKHAQPGFAGGFKVPTTANLGYSHAKRR